MTTQVPLTVTTPQTRSRVAVEHVARRDWRLTRDLAGVDGVATAAPAGMLTDFGSRPRLVAAIIPDTDTATECYVLHDARYRRDIPLGRCTYRAADWELLAGLRLAGTPCCQRWITWTGVRWAGLLVRGRAGRAGWGISDTLALLFWTLVALPLVVLPAWCSVPLLALLEVAAAGIAVALRWARVLPPDRYVPPPTVTTTV